jgi:hypothetical protein
VIRALKQTGTHVGCSVDTRGCSPDKENGSMQTSRWFRLCAWLLAVALVGSALGAAKAEDKKVDEAKIKKNLAKLSAKDRKVAVEQKFCAIEDENRLGAMGVPIKLTIKGQPVFLCCNDCKKEALADPDKTLAKVKELKEKNKKESDK